MGFLEAKTLNGKLKALDISQDNINNYLDLLAFTKEFPREKIESETKERVTDNANVYDELIKLSNLISYKPLTKKIEKFEAINRVKDLLEFEKLTPEQLDEMEKDILFIGEDDELESLFDDRINN